MVVGVSDYVEVNRANWDDRVPIHVASEFYDVEGWLSARPGPQSWELEFLGDVAGLDVAHLQCHIGLDTLGLADAGARVRGLDFSPEAIATATTLAQRAGLGDRADFVEADVFDAVNVLGRDSYDLVYVSLGALCWLPSVDAWAEQVAGLLRVGGRLYIHDGHPLAWALGDDELRVEHTYFEEPEPHVDDIDVTYTDGEGRLANSRQYEWNHSIGEIVSAVTVHGLIVDRLVEHDWTLWARFPWLSPSGDGRWLTPPDRPRVPLSFTLTATRTNEPVDLE
jgi:SAM-dependent methyltransferase